MMKKSFLKNVITKMVSMATAAAMLLSLFGVAAFAEGAAITAADYEPENVIASPGFTGSVGAVLSWRNPKAELAAVDVYDGETKLNSEALSAAADEIVSYTYTGGTSGDTKTFTIRFTFADGTVREVDYAAVLTDASNKNVNLAANFSYNYVTQSAATAHPKRMAYITTVDGKKVLCVESNDYLQSVSGWNEVERLWFSYSAKTTAKAEYKVTFKAKSDNGFNLTIREASNKTSSGSVTVPAGADWEEYTATMNTNNVGGSQSSIRMYLTDFAGTAYIEDLTITEKKPDATEATAILTCDFNDAAEPAADVAITEGIIGEDAPVLEWSKADDSCNYTRIYEKIDGKLYLRARIPATETSYSMSGITAGNTYTYAVKAETMPIAAAGTGLISVGDEYTFTAVKSNPANYEPENIIATPSSDSSAPGTVLSWVNPKAQLSKVSVYVKNEDKYDLLSDTISTTADTVAAYTYAPEGATVGQACGLKLVFDFADGTQREVQYDADLAISLSALNFTSDGNLNAGQGYVNKTYASIVYDENTDNRVLSVVSNEVNPTGDIMRLWFKQADKIPAGQYTVAFKAKTADEFKLKVQEAQNDKSSGGFTVAKSDEWKSYTAGPYTFAGNVNNNIRLVPTGLVGEALLDDIVITNADSSVSFSLNFDENVVTSPISEASVTKAAADGDKAAVSFVPAGWAEDGSIRQYCRVYENIGGKLFLRARCYLGQNTPETGSAVLTNLDSGLHKLVIKAEKTPIINDGSAVRQFIVSKGTSYELDTPAYVAGAYRMYAGASQINSLSGELTEIKVRIVNEGEAAIAPRMIVALYNGDIFKGAVVSDEATAEPGAAETLVCSNINTDGADKIKVMLWDGFDGLAPLKAATDANIGQ